MRPFLLKENFQGEGFELRSLGPYFNSKVWITGISSPLSLSLNEEQSNTSFQARSKLQKWC